MDVGFGFSYLLDFVHDHLINQLLTQNYIGNRCLSRAVFLFLTDTVITTLSVKKRRGTT
jgi:hypothetical protein